MRPATNVVAPGSLVVSLVVSFVASLAASLALACGGGNATPALTPDPTKDSGTESFAEVNPSDVAELDSGAGTPSSTPSTSSTSTTSSTPSSPEPKDECTPVGVDFEKRARPKLKDCYAVAKKKDANLQGTVRISVDIDIYGKIKATKIVEKTLPDSVAQCMLKVVKATALPDAGKCAGKSLTIPVTFPTPH